MLAWFHPGSGKGGLNLGHRYEAEAHIGAAGADGFQQFVRGRRDEDHYDVRRGSSSVLRKALCAAGCMPSAGSITMTRVCVLRRD